MTFEQAISKISGAFQSTNKKGYTFKGSLQECIDCIENNSNAGQPFYEVGDWLCNEEENDGCVSIVKTFAVLSSNCNLIFDCYGFTLQRVG